MKVYVEAEFPEVCYLSEAVVWVALGRVPKIQYTMEEGVPERGLDFRLSTALPKKEADSEACPPFFETNEPFTKSEFTAFDVEIDYVRYECNFYETGGNSGHEYLRLSAELMPEYDDYYFGIKSLEDIGDNFMLRSIIEADVREAKYRDEAIKKEEIFVPLINEARKKLFEQLQAGNIPAHGWGKKIPEDATAKPGSQLGKYIKVDKSEWAYRNVDWNNSTLIRSEKQFFGVLVGVEELLKLFPTPLIKAKLNSTKIYAGTVIADSDDNITDQITKRPRVGRPPEQPRVAKAYHELFPNGHGSLTWKEVNAKLLEITDIHVHEDTIKRALGLK